MKKEYITINRNTYNALAKEYENREYSVKEDFTKQSFDSLFIDEGYNIFEKKYKEETDTVRSKLWQILYLKNKDFYKKETFP